MSGLRNLLSRRGFSRAFFPSGYNDGQMFGLIAGAAAVAYAGYATMGPRSQLYGRSFLGVSGSKLLALTYDDGPNEAHTPALLDILAQHGAKATFFLIGRYVVQRPDIVRRIRQEGHAIGNHTYNHPLLTFASAARLGRELDDTDKAIADAAGPHDGLFRPPFGGRRPGTFAAVRARGMTPVMWTVTCFDWNARSADPIERHAVRGIRGGDIILLHDGSHLKMGADRAPTVEATTRLLRRYQADGYRFVTIPEMMRAAE